MKNTGVNGVRVGYHLWVSFPGKGIISGDPTLTRSAERNSVSRVLTTCGIRIYLPMGRSSGIAK